MECPYCGNPKLEKINKSAEAGKISDFIWYCPICEKKIPLKFEEQLSALTKTSGDVNGLWEAIEIYDYRSFEKTHGKEWANYVKNIIEEKGDCQIAPGAIWALYLFKEDSNGNIIVDVSEENINRCKGIYQKDSDDINNFIRLFLLKIFKGQKDKNLTNKFVKLYISRSIDIYSLIFHLASLTYLLELIKPYFTKLQAFFKWLVEYNDLPLRELINSRYYRVGHNPDFIGALWKLISPDNMFKLLNPDSIYRADLEEVYLECYILAEIYYKKQEWPNAFKFFNKLRVYNKLKNVDDDFVDSNQTAFLEDSEDVTRLPRHPVTVDYIAEKARECFNNLFEQQQKADLEEVIEVETAFHVNLTEKRNELESHVEKQAYFANLFLDLFRNIYTNNYEEAFRIWTESDKERINFMGIDVWKVTKFLKAAKEGRLREKLEDSELFSNPFLKGYHTIFKLENELREFISGVLSEHYGNKREAWARGIPGKIRGNVSQIRGAEDPYKKEKEWKYTAPY